MDSIFYLMLSPLFLAVIAALVVIARGSKGVKHSIISALVIVGLGVLGVIALFVIWTAIYFAGGGH